MIITNNTSNPDMYLGTSKVKKIYLGDNAIYEEVNYANQYFTIESLDDNNSIRFTCTQSSNQKRLDWSKDGVTWTTSYSTSLPIINKGEKLLLRGNAMMYGTYKYSHRFSSSGNVNLCGNIMSLCGGNNFQNLTMSYGYTFLRLFQGLLVVDASNLILPSNVTNNCYQYMFSNISTLTKAPTLPATTLADSCYDNMFYGCSSLNYIKMMATNISASNCLSNWVGGVSASGTFVKNAEATWSATGSSGVPEGWTVETAVA